MVVRTLHQVKFFETETGPFNNKVDSQFDRGFEDGKDYNLDAAFTSRQGSNGHLIQRFFVKQDFLKIWV